MLQLIITEPAQLDVTSISDYITTNSYAKYAVMFGDKLSDLLELLCHTPNMGVEKASLGEGVRLYPLDKVNIIYRVSGDELQVLRLYHSALDFNTLEL